MAVDRGTGLTRQHALQFQVFVGRACGGDAAGAVSFKQKLSQIATLYRDPKDGFESKVSVNCPICLW